MALTELVSNLSVGLYGAPTPSQFVMPIGPGSSNTPTDAVTFATTNNGSLFYIQNSGNGISRRIVQGFNNLGYLAFFGNKQSKDNYPLFTALGESGTSRRMNQGGIGFPFPIGPTGNVYDWKPNAHTGWNINNRYNDTIKKTLTFGLADTYTTNSPIDDIYNKVKVRSEAWNRNSFGLATDQPFILRGIQRDNNSDPQFWGGFADTISDTPRGGISAFVERDLVDKVRIGKFLLSPKGLAYSAKQFGLQLMNPNVESFLGVPIPAPAPLTNKFYNPLSPLYQNPLLGVRARRDTILPVDIGYRYGDIFTIRNVTGLGTQFNRLNLLRQETFGPIGTASGAAVGIAPGLPFLTLTSVTGPKSVFGLGITPISRYTNTSLSQYNLLGPNFTNGLAFVTNPIALIDVKKQSTAASGIAYNAARYTYLNPYLGLVPPYDPGSDDSIWSNTGNAKLSKIIKDPTSFPGNSKVLDKNRSNSTAQAGKEYSTLAYGNLRKTNDSTNYNDFRFGVRANNFTSFIGNPEIADYAENNLFKKYGIPEYGAAGLNRSDPTKPAVTDGDLIGTANFAKKDLIDFSMSLSTGTTLRFRAFINSISTNWSPSDEEAFRGSAAQVLKEPKYVGVDHQVTVDFVIPIFSQKERGTVYAKLNALAKAFYGIGSSSNGISTRQHVLITPLKIGNFLQMPCVMNSLSYDIDNETPWDIDTETPMVIACSISFTEIASGTIPSANGTKTVIGF